MAFALVAGSGGTARADVFMACGREVAHGGDSLGTVVAKCGPPTTQAHHDQQVVTCTGEVAVAHTYDTWTYDFGPSSFVRIARFVDGALAGVATGDYGTAGHGP